jgi:hypothetical protein
MGQHNITIRPIRTYTVVTEHRAATAYRVSGHAEAGVIAERIVQPTLLPGWALSYWENSQRGTWTLFASHKRSGEVLPVATVQAGNHTVGNSFLPEVPERWTVSTPNTRRYTVIGHERAIAMANRRAAEVFTGQTVWVTARNAEGVYDNLYALNRTGERSRRLALVAHRHNH